MKIIGFTQLYNELERGNLLNWFRCMEGCDYIYIYDQASTDGSQDIYKQHDNVVYIQSETNDFANEQICKAKLYDKVLKDHPDTRWIMWLDGDTILDGRLCDNGGKGLRDFCTQMTLQPVGGFYFGHYNLWRSDKYYRVDNCYHDLHYRRLGLWKHTSQIKFGLGKGLHQPGEPAGIFSPQPCPYSLIHRGFATDNLIIWKHDMYKANGQTGWALDRLIDENGLTVHPLPEEIIPSWYEMNDTVNPKTKTLLRAIYEDKDSYSNV